MADGTYLRAYHEYATRDVTADDIEVLVLTDAGTPVFDEQDTTVAEVLARAENTESAISGYARTDVPTLTDTDGVLDHATVSMTAVGAENWTAVVYFRNVDDDDAKSPVLFFKEVTHTTDGSNVEIDTHASGLGEIVKTRRQGIMTTDENARYHGIRYADENVWATTHNALSVANVV